ncbi:MAG: ABC transporter transmembrane domain-containing protein, partial [Candidatus Izemoplasmatales bacterium]|nr:ABC transporter transmembrane domain-containing protein [Candidatus Izemoplasmatales bacterium]
MKKAKTMINKRVLELVNGSKKRIFLSAMFQWIALLINVGIIAIVVYIFESIYHNNMKQELIYFIIFSFMLIVLRAYIIKNASLMNSKIATSAKHQLRERLFTKLTKLSRKETESYGSAELTQLGIEGIEQLELYFSIFLPQVVFGLVAPVTVFLIISCFYVPMALILLFSVPLIPGLIIFANHQAKKKYPKYWKSYTLLGDVFYDNVLGLSVLKSYVADEKEHLQLNHQADDFRVATMRVLKMQLNSITIMDLVAYGGAAFSILLGATSVIQQQLNPFAGIFIILVASEFFLPLRSLGSAFHIATNGIMALKKLFLILDIPVHERSTEIAHSIHPIIFDHVSFSYQASNEIIKAFSFHFPTKGIVAVVGQSGSGKSTLGLLLSNEYQTTNGVITLNDIDINLISYSSIFKHIAVLNQDNYCFQGTIRDNLKLNYAQATDSECLLALEKAGLSSYISSNSLGLDYPILERGS